MVNLCQVLQRFGDVFEYFITPVLVQHLASPEKHCELYLVPLLQKCTGVIQFYIQIVLIGFGPKSDFLERSDVMMAFFAAFATLAFLLIQPFAVIHYATNRRGALRGNLHKVQADFSGLANGQISFYNPQLIV